MIFHDLLGEVGEVLNRQAHLQASLDKTGTEVASRIAWQTVKLQETIDKVGPELAKHVARSLHEHLDASKAQVATVAKASVEDQVKASTTALARANEAVVTASRQLEAAAANASRLPVVIGLVAVVSAAVGSLATTAVFWLVDGKHPALNRSTQTSYLAQPASNAKTR